MTTVLAAISDDASAAPVLGAAKELARVLGAEPHAVHAGRAGKTVRTTAAKAGVPLETTDRPAPEGLTEAARAPEVSMLVIGARSTPGGRRPAGRTALAAATELGKPVLVVPPAAMAERPIRRILVPLDGTATTAEALQATIALARERDIAVVVLHVHEEHAIPPFEDQPHHEREAWAREFIARYCGRPVEDVGLEIRTGLPHEHVLDVAKELDVDALVLGWHRTFQGGRAAVVREALARSPVPVLLIPVRASARSGARPRARAGASIR
jgi:nucleotide-binding universal stress UspA family protein